MAASTGSPCERTSSILTASKIRLNPNVVNENDLPGRLRAAGVRPSAQRMAVAEYVLTTEDHPSAEQVHTRVTKRWPYLSRATVYNTLNLFVTEGLLKQLVLSEGRVVFDPKIERHHHFIDDVTGRIEDVPWDAVKVGDARLDGYDVREYMVVLRGRKTRRPSVRPSPPATQPSRKETKKTKEARRT
jgi:Fur family transcriptional regulator, iron response regulator